MAEIAAGAVAVEQIVSTGLEAGAVAAVSRPTQLSTVSLTRINLNAPELARFHHTVTVIGDSAYIFGGRHTSSEICGTNVVEVPLPSEKNPNCTQYASYHAHAVNPVGTGEAALPQARYGHAACARNDTLVIHGGGNANGPLTEEASHLWIWNTKGYTWSRFGPAQPGGDFPQARYGHRIFYDSSSDLVVLHGGKTTIDDTESAETWIFDFETAEWTKLAFAPSIPMCSVFDSSTLYTLTSESDWVQSLKVSGDGTTAEWSISETTSAGPQREPGIVTALLRTGLGRCYLLQLLGGTKTDVSGGNIWSLQLPSGSFSGAGIKDAIRNTLPKLESGSLSWAEVQVATPDPETQSTDGKLHPGPRKYFGADDFGDGQRIILWGGLNAKGEVEGDGWVLDFA